MAQLDAIKMLFRILLIVTVLNSCFGRIDFTAEPTNAVVAENSKLLIPCTATTTLSGTLLILWKKQNNWIVDFNSKHYSQLANGSLLFQRFLNADQGVYQCSAIVQSSGHHRLGQVYSRNATIKLAYILSTFTLNPETRSGQLGSSLQLQCLSPKSEPIANVYWEKDNMRLHGYENGSLILKSENVLSCTLMIRNLSIQHIGTYRCSAYNVLMPGKIIKSNTATVSIAARQEQPYFETRPVSVVASRYQPYIWKCVIRGIPQPTIEWYQNGIRVTNDANRLKLTSGSLHFVSVQEAHNGTYVCEGSNSIGKVSNSPVPFVVAFIDYVFVQNPISRIINAGQTLILRCSPPRRYPISATISWYWNYSLLKKSANIIILSDGSLQISAVTKSIEGVYFCGAENPVTRERRTSKTATVSVRVGPIINTALNNISAIVGQSLTISCNATGSPNPSIQWLKGNQVMVNNGVLLLSRISMADTGFYTCKAMNPAGNESKTLYLKVSTTPSINIAPLNSTRIEGGSVEMKCDFYGDPMPTTTWYFMANTTSSLRLIRTTSRVSLTEITLRIVNIVKADEGRYICRGENTGGQREVSAFLVVLVPPSFISLPTNKTTIKGSSVTFQCVAAGFPIPFISWYFRGHQLATNSKYTVGSTSVTVKNADDIDSGWYMCRISNSAGLKNSTAYLDVQVAPLITDFSVPHTVKIGSSFLLKCMGTGNPKPIVRWQQNKTNVVIDGLRITGNMENLTVHNAGSQDSGIYVCRLSNFLGSSNQNQSLLVQVFPHPPKSLQAKSFQSTSITVSWVQGFDGYSPTLGFILQFSRKGVEDWRTYANNIASSFSNYTVVGLKPFTAYKFRMKAFTSIGQSVYSIHVEARTLEDAPSVPLGLTVRIANETTAIVEWKRPSEEQGVISLYQLHYGIIDTSSIKTIDVIARNQSNHQITIHHLRPFSTYYFRMRAATGPKSSPNWGNVSDVVYGNTPETAPSSAPVIQNSSAVSSTSIRILLIGLTSHALNGILTGYHFFIKSQVSQEIIITNNTILNVGNLLKFHRYEVTVMACNRAGCGPKSQSVFVTTHEDIPGTVTNVSATQMNSTSILIKWNEPLQKNGLITGYIITLKNMHNNRNETLLVGRNVYQLLKHGLMPNKTFYIKIAAKTSKGIGPLSKEIIINLRAHDTTTTSSKGLTSSIPQTTQSSTSSTGTPKVTTPFGKTKAQTSVDWLDEKNLPILIGVSVTILILLIIVIVFIAMTCARRLVAGDVKRDRWINTRTHSGGDNPAYDPNKDVELKHKTPVMSPRASDLQPNKVEIPKKIENMEDFLFENDSEQPVEEINPANGYAFDETVRMKGKDDKSPLVKLRDTEIDLGDNASEYDRPYSKLDELGESFSNDLFAFIEDEEKQNEFSSQESLPTKDESDAKSATSIDFEPILTGQLPEGIMFNLRDPKPKDIPYHESPIPKSELTWDPYDTSKAAEKSVDENEYDVPEIYHADTEAIIPDSPDAEAIGPDHSRDSDADIPKYSTVDKSYLERKAANLAGSVDNNDTSGLINNESAPSYGVF